MTTEFRVNGRNVRVNEATVSPSSVSRRMQYDDNGVLGFIALPVAYKIRAWLPDNSLGVLAQALSLSEDQRHLVQCRCGANMYVMEDSIFTTTNSVNVSEKDEGRFEVSINSDRLYFEFVGQKLSESSDGQTQSL